jgi:hydroxymethyl cephem carbamoyltransferase
MRILGIKPPHDGSMAFINDNELIFAIEGEKDSHPRYSGLTLPKVFNALSATDEIPDVIALGDDATENAKDLSTYFGINETLKKATEIKLAGQNVKIFVSSHERAHIYCAYGLSPFPQGEPYYALCWEGAIGRFYYISPDLQIHGYDTVMKSPGVRYILPYFVANDKKMEAYQIWDLSMAGKMMALTGYGAKDQATALKWQAIIREMTNYQFEPLDNINLYQQALQFFRRFPVNRLGIENQDFKDFAFHYSEAIFNKFYEFAAANLKGGFPLLITGGCGLNCDWNTKWKESGLFADVFIPPCPNDSGIGIGIAIDALHHFTGNAKIKWSVYAGEEFNNDSTPGMEFWMEPLNYNRLTELLAQGKIFAWVQGKYEIGPRALGNRSLIAAPFSRTIWQRLNHIKQREQFRPVAPVCTEESVSRFFNWQGPSPYMLHFMEVTNPDLQAVTHVDHSARAQTVTRDQNPKLYDLLNHFSTRTGYPVLCNTSLNYKNKGFINCMSDLTAFILQNDVDGMVVGDLMFIKKERGID